MIVRLSFIAAMALAVPAGPTAAQSLSLTGEAGQTATVTAAELAALPHVHVSVTQHGQVHAYDGVLLGDLLAKVGAPRGEAIKGPELAALQPRTAIRWCWTWRRPIRSPAPAGSSWPTARRARP